MLVSFFVCLIIKLRANETIISVSLNQCCLCWGKSEQLRTDFSFFFDTALIFRPCRALLYFLSLRLWRSRGRTPNSTVALIGSNISKKSWVKLKRFPRQVDGQYPLLTIWGPISLVAVPCIVTPKLSLRYMLWFVGVDTVCMEGVSGMYIPPRKPRVFFSLT